MKWRWMALLLAAFLSTAACNRTETKSDDPDLNLDIEPGVDAKPEEINTDRTSESKPTGDTGDSDDAKNDDAASDSGGY